MKPKNWRTLAEIIGIVSIVAGLLLVAWEIRQANDIARAEVIMNLAEQYNDFNSARFENPDVAELSNWLQFPDQYQLSDIDRSRMSGAAWHFANILWSAQIAYDSGILSIEDLSLYQSHLGWMLKYMPGLAHEFVYMWETAHEMREAPVFQPLGQHVATLADGGSERH